MLLCVDYTFAFAIPAYVPHGMSGQGEKDQGVTVAFDQVITELGIGQW